MFIDNKTDLDERTYIPYILQKELAIVKHLKTNLAHIHLQTFPFSLLSKLLTIIKN
jgi:hypothetical protein